MSCTINHHESIWSSSFLSDSEASYVVGSAGSELTLSGQGRSTQDCDRADLHRPIKGSISGIGELKVTINNAVRRHHKPRPGPGAKPAPQYSTMPIVPSVWHVRLERAARGTNRSWCRSRKHVALW